MYLASPSNIVQALDGKTGNLIWETRVGPDQAPGYGGIRSIAIAQDKVFLPTSNAHMVALSARTGDILWDTPLSDVQSSIHERRDRHRRQGAAGNHRLRTQYVRRWVLHQRHRYQHGKARVEVLHDSARRRAGLRHVGQASQRAARRRRDVDCGLLRSRFESHVLGNRAVEAVVVPQSRDDAVRQDALLELDARVERRHRKARVVLPARARRIVRSRRGVRARARRYRHAESVVQRRQGGRVVEARSPHRTVPRPQGDGRSRPSGSASIPKPACRAIGPTFSRCSSIRH